MTKTQTKSTNTRSVAQDVAACLIVSASVRGTAFRISCRLSKSAVEFRRRMRGLVHHVQDEHQWTEEER